MKRRVLLYTGVFLLLSCAERAVKKPESLIPKDTMVRMLEDIALLSAAESSFPQTLSSYGIAPMELLYQKYEVDSTQFAQSHLYYASLPPEYQAMYEAVAKKIDQNKEALEADATKTSEKNC